MDAQQLTDAFEDVFDHALVFHGFTDYMRDHDVFVHPTADPAPGSRLRTCVTASRTASARR